MAESLAQSTCLGIDLSERQIADGQAFMKATGLTNLELRNASILDIDESYGTFDYIVCHGVFSWVEPHVQQRILEVCSKHLSPQGIAYISYNTYPGWHMKGMLRDMMRFHASRFKAPEKQIAQSRALLNVLASAVPSGDNPYGMLLKQESEKLRRCSDWYIYHEQLELNNDPVYFHEFVQRAHDCGLQFLAESELRAMLTDQLSPEIQAALREVGTSLVYSEQYLDFFRNRTFRQTLLCHRDVALNRNLDAESFRPLNFASALSPQSTITDIERCPSMVFERQGWPTITARGPICLAALLCLHDAWPEYVSAAELEQRVRTRLALAPATQESSRDFVDLLGTWFTKGIVKISVAPPACTSKISPLPLASVVARAQAKMGKLTVANLLHQNVLLNSFDAHLLSLLDGTLDREGIVRRTIEYVQIKKDSGSEQPHDAGSVGAKVQSGLESLASAALLRA
jgi:methyltransferase-like protein